MSELEFQFIGADEALKCRITDEWGEQAARHMHLEDGFSILAVQENHLVGLISVSWKILPPPLPETCEGFIDILKVYKDFRRRGIARQLIDISLERAKRKDAYQMRAWSSLDK